MKIIEALKKTKDLQRKCEDLRNKVQVHAADLDFGTPIYVDQASQLKEWLQSHSDTVKEIARLRVAIQRTNITTNVEIELGGVRINKSIAEWIHWRKDLALMQQDLFKRLTDKGLKEGNIAQTNGTSVAIKIRRYYDPKERDKMIELYRSQPSTIDGTLEVVNATTDLME